jgi:hypothetical protein
MINNANAYAKCKNCDRINGNHNIKGTKNDKNEVSTMAADLHIISKHIRLKAHENHHPPRFCGFGMRFG